MRDGYWKGVVVLDREGEGQWVKYLNTMVDGEGLIVRERESGDGEGCSNSGRGQNG